MRLNINMIEPIFAGVIILFFLYGMFKPERNVVNELTPMSLDWRTEHEYYSGKN